MDESLSVQADLMKAFPRGIGNLRVPRARRVFGQVPYERFPEVFEHAVRRMGFSMLCTITALDGGASFEVIYHLARPSGVTLNLSTLVPKDRPVLQTVTGCFPAADLYEREMVDLMGIQVQGLPTGHRYPLPDDWPDGQYPLRKDWKAPSVSGQPDAPEDQLHA